MLGCSISSVCRERNQGALSRARIAVVSCKTYSQIDEKDSICIHAWLTWSQAFDGSKAYASKPEFSVFTWSMSQNGAPSIIWKGASSNEIVQSHAWHSGNVSKRCNYLERPAGCTKKLSSCYKLGGNKVVNFCLGCNCLCLDKLLKHLGLRVR